MFVSQHPRPSFPPIPSVSSKGLSKPTLPLMVHTPPYCSVAHKWPPQASGSLAGGSFRPTPLLSARDCPTTVL